MELDAQARLAEELRQPAQMFYVITVRAMLAAMEGRYAEAQRLIPQAFALGQRAERAMSQIYQALQLYTLRRGRGGLEDVERALQACISDFPTYVVLRCVLAQVLIELGRDGEARAAFESLATDRFGPVPHNDEWVFGMTLLSEVAVHLRDAPRAAVLYEHLLPITVESR
jgi:hypothetical protein